MKKHSTTSSSINTSTSSRIAAHTHITGLGLNERGEVDDDNDTTATRKCGLIGQCPAREAMGLIADLIQLQKLAGRAVLLTGPPGTGKTALAIALSKSIGSGSGGASSITVPFCPMVASAVYSREVKKTEILSTYFRKAIGLRIRERKEVYEGEVTELSVEETEDPLASTTSYGRTISHVIITLKTTKGTKTLKLDPIMYDALQKEQVQRGDVIYIESTSGAVKRVGRSDTYATEFDLEAEEYVPLPKGDVHKQREIVQDLTLHDLDVANAAPPTSSGGNDIMALLASVGGKRKKTEITDKLRQEINKVVEKYIHDGIAELVPGVLFIDEVHMFDMECFTFLNRSLESTLSPIVVLATNRGITHITNTQITAPHGIPIDLLDRLLIIPTLPYTVKEMMQIVAIRANIENITLHPPTMDTTTTSTTDVTGNEGTVQVPTNNTVLQQLGIIAERTSLRYAIQLLTPANLLAETVGRAYITVEDLHNVDGLFMDSKASSSMLQQHGTDKGYM